MGRTAALLGSISMSVWYLLRGSNPGGGSFGCTPPANGLDALLSR